MRRRRILLLTLAGLLILAALVGVAWWLSAPERAARPDKAPDAQVMRQRGRTAIRFEKAARQWGVDPTLAASAQGSDGDAMAYLKARRTPERMDEGDLKAISVIRAADGAGPKAPSPWCRDKVTGLCKTQPDMYAYRRANAWLMGARLDGEPQATGLADGRVRVSGRVRVALWSDVTGTGVYATSSGSWWAYTPVTGSVAYSDVLTFDKAGRVTARETQKDTPWFADPWYGDWSDEPMSWAENLAGRSQPSIPLKGSPPELNLEHDPDVPILANQYDFSGNAWKGITSKPESRPWLEKGTK